MFPRNQQGSGFPGAGGGLPPGMAGGMGGGLGGPTGATAPMPLPKFTGGKKGKKAKGKGRVPKFKGKAPAGGPPPGGLAGLLGGGATPGGMGAGGY